MQTEWHGFYLDGRTAARHPVTVYLTPYGAEIRGHDGARHLWRYGEMRRAQGAFRHEPIRLERGSPLPEAIVVDDAEFGEALTRFMPDAPSPIFDARLHRRLPWIVAATLAAVAALAAIAMWGIPLLAEAAAPLVPAVWEHALGQAVFARLTAGEQRCTDPELTSALQAIVRRLSAARPDAGYSFELAVVESPDYNAFAAPAGYIVILRPLLDATASPEELAGVLAHEMQHVYQRHATKALLRDASIGMMVGALLGDVGGIGAIAVQAGRTLTVLHYSRDTEEEADREGLHLLNDAKIDRAGMITFFEHLEQKHGASDVPGYLSTHPNPRQRITALSAETKALTNAAEPIMLSLPWKEIRSRCR